MIKMVILGAIVSVLPINTAYSITSDYDLPGLIGTYPDSSWAKEHREVYFGPPGLILKVEVSLTGEVTQGYVDCYEGTSADTVLAGIAPTFMLMTSWPNNGLWMGPEQSVADGPFSYDKLVPIVGGSKQINTGDDLLFYVFVRAEPNCTLVDPWPECRIDRAHVTITITGTIAAEPTTWGRIKALFH